MANKQLLQEMDDTPPQICFANHAGDFNPTGANDLRKGTDQEIEIVILNWADGAYIQSAQFDLGAHFAERYALKACIEMQVAVADLGSVIGAWINGSSSATPATGNMGAASGSAAAYTGYSADPDTAIKQCVFVGNMIMTDDAVDSVQIGFMGDYYPSDRYGSLLLKQDVGQVICDTDDIEAHLVLIPVIPEQQ